MSAPLLERVPPQSLEAEQATLGAMLTEREAIARVVDVLDPDDFYSPQHQVLYRAMIDLFNDSEPVDLVTLQARLQDRGQLDQVGGTPYLLSLQEASPTAAAVSHYARIVREKSTLRGLIRAAGEIRNMAQSPGDESVETILDRCEQEVFAVSERTIAPAFTPIRELLGETYDRIDEMQETHRPGTGLASGYDDLDSLTSGLQPSDLVVVAARPSMGKTALAINIGSHIAKTQNKTVAVFSLEMAKEQLALRLLCSEARVNQQNVRQGYLERGDMDRIAIAASDLYKAPMYFDDTPSMSVLQMRGKSRRLRAEHGLDMIIVDYLQLVSGYGHFENRNQEISQVARALKALARELKIPVLALSQLSRAVEARGHPHRPMLSDLRESGSIEQEADVVCFIYRPAYYAKYDDREMQAAGYLDTDQHIAEIIVAKQRNGPTGTVRLSWLDEYVRFENLEERFVSPEGEQVTPRLAASLTTIVGLSMLAGWLSAFRNRAYLGWMGLSFMAVSGYLMAYDAAQNARTYSLPVGGAALVQKLCLLVCAITFVLAVTAAVRETRRRLREIKESHQAAEEALLAMLKSSAAKEAVEGEGKDVDADNGTGT